MTSHTTPVASSMTNVEPLDKTQEYNLFRSWAALKAITALKPTEKLWRFYECGPKEIAPLVCLPGVSGGASSFWRQMLQLCQAKGYHIISVDIPPYWSHNEFVVGFEDFLDSIKVETVHLLGCSLGGFLAQLFAEQRPERVSSLVLTNSFCSTSTFTDAAPCMEMFRVMPNFLLKRAILKNFPQGEQELEIARSIDFMVESLQAMPRSQVASRLTLNCLDRMIGKLSLSDDNITIIDVLDEVATPLSAREQLYQTYSGAKVGFLKRGGNFPYLSYPDDFNVQLEVHLRHVMHDAGRPDAAASEQQQNTAGFHPEMDEAERLRQEQWRQEVIEEEKEEARQRLLDPPETGIEQMASEETREIKGEIEIEVGSGTNPHDLVQDQHPSYSSPQNVASLSSGNILDEDEDLAVGAQTSPPYQTDATTDESASTAPAPAAIPEAAGHNVQEIPIDPNLAWSQPHQPTHRTPFEEIPL